MGFDRFLQSSLSFTDLLPSLEGDEDEEEEEEEEEEQMVEIDRGSEENLAFAMKHVIILILDYAERKKAACC